MVRRSLADPTDLAHYVCYGPAEAAPADLVRVAGTRWTIEECLEAAKGQVGLDHYHVRRWNSWYRHVTLCLLAHAFLTATRARAAAGERGGTADGAPPAADRTGGAPAFYRLLWAEPPPDQALGWSQWRRRHQARARRCHYRQRLARFREKLRLYY